MTPAVRAPITQLLTLSEAGSRLGLSESAVTTLIDDGVFAKLRVSAGGWRIWPDDVDAYVIARAANVARPDGSPTGSLPQATGRRHLAAPVRPARPAAPRLLTIRRLGVNPTPGRWQRFGGSTVIAPAAFLAFPNRERALHYLQTCSSDAADRQPPAGQEAVPAGPRRLSLV